MRGDEQKRGQKIRPTPSIEANLDTSEVDNLPFSDIQRKLPVVTTYTQIHS